MLLASPILGLVQENMAMAFISIGSFFVIFLIAILWATRPEKHAHEAQHHGTEEQHESLIEA